MRFFFTNACILDLIQRIFVDFGRAILNILWCTVSFSRFQQVTVSNILLIPECLY